MKKIFCLICWSVYFKIRKFIFRQSESCVFTMSSWSPPVKICGLESSTEVQLPTVSGNLKKMIYSCLCTSFVSCYCVVTEKIDENGSVATIDHFSRLLVGSLLVSYGDSNVWPCVAWGIVASHRATYLPTYPPTYTYMHTYIHTCLLLLISMLWHRQAIFKSKGDKLCSSAESRI